MDAYDMFVLLSEFSWFWMFEFRSRMMVRIEEGDRGSDDPAD